MKKIKLENYQHFNGLFPASINSENELMNKYFWIRDNYYIYFAVNSFSKLRIIKAFQKIVDYNNKLGKFNKKSIEDNEHIYPVYNENLQNISGEWAFVQNDAVGNLLEILVEAKDKYRANKLVKYLEKNEYWNCADSGFWEEEKEIRSSSLAACIRALENYQNNFGENRKIREIINFGYQALKSILPNETANRKSDLALLSLLYPNKLNYKIINRNLKQEIIKNIAPLIGEYGVKRYLEDKWDGISWTLGKGKEMQWTIGLPWLYLSTSKEEYFKKAQEIKEKYITLPEGIIEEKPNCTPYLLWSEALFRLAEKKLKKSKQ